MVGRGNICDFTSLSISLSRGYYYYYYYYLDLDINIELFTSQFSSYTDFKSNMAESIVSTYFRFQLTRDPIQLPMWWVYVFPLNESYGS